VFDEETKIGQEIEAWILGMEKYFEVHDYSSIEKSILAIYHLSGISSIS
jgi:predicted ferric reductase